MSQVDAQSAGNLRTLGARRGTVGDQVDRAALRRPGEGEPGGRTISPMSPPSTRPAFLNSSRLARVTGTRHFGIYDLKSYRCMLPSGPGGNDAKSRFPNRRRAGRREYGDPRSGWSNGLPRKCSPSRRREGAEAMGNRWGKRGL